MRIAVPPIRRLIVPFCFSLFAGIGFLWSTILEPLYGLPSGPESKLTYPWYLVLGLFAGTAWFIFDGLFVGGFLRQSIEIISNAIDLKVTVKFGDIFDQDGCTAISVNEFFDSAVDGRHVAAGSLHGAMLSRYWAGHTADWDRQIAQELAPASVKEIVATRPAPAKPNRYEIGTTARAIKGDREFLCVALTRTCAETLEASATSQDLQFAVRGLLTKARSVCSGRTLNIPLLGSGLARTGIKPNIIVDLILLAIFEESKRKKVTNEIRIVLPKEMVERIDLTTIKKDWC